MNDGSAVSVEQFAQLRAAMEVEGQPSGVLARAGLSFAESSAATKYHLEALAREVRAGGRELSERYLRVYLRGVEKGGRTAEVDTSAVRAARKMPFVAVIPPPGASAETGDETLAPASDAPMTLPFRAGLAPAPPPPEYADPSGETKAADSEAPGRSLPFEMAGMQMMKLERYIDMAAELRARPADADAIMTRLGLVTTEQRERIHHLWHLRFEANAELRSRFLRAVEERVATLASDPSKEER